MALSTSFCDKGVHKVDEKNPAPFDRLPKIVLVFVFPRAFWGLITSLSTWRPPNCWVVTSWLQPNLDVCFFSRAPRNLNMSGKCCLNAKHLTPLVCFLCRFFLCLKFSSRETWMCLIFLSMGIQEQARLPETTVNNIANENWWLEDDPFASFWGILAYFQGYDLLVLGSLRPGSWYCLGLRIWIESPWTTVTGWSNLHPPRYQSLHRILLMDSQPTPPRNDPLEIRPYWGLINHWFLNKAEN